MIRFIYRVVRSITRRPELHSGFLVIAMLSCAFGADHAPLRLLFNDLFSPVQLQDTVFSLLPGDTVQLNRAFSTFDYDDYYHAKRIDHAQTPSTRIDRIAESPRYIGGIFIKRSHWAISPSLSVRKVFIRDYSSDATYQSYGSMSAEKAGISGWYNSGQVMMALRISGNFDKGLGESLQHKKTTDFLALHGDYAVMAGMCLNDMYISAYAASELLPLAHYTVENTADSASITASMCALYQTLGIKAQLQKLSYTFATTVGYSLVRCDTQATAGNSLPVTLSTGIVQGNMYAQWKALSYKPHIYINAGLAYPSVRSYDGSGGPSYFSIDDNTALLGSAELGATGPLAIDGGVTAEYFSIKNTGAGRLDPYLFSSMTFFVPTKFKLDSLMLNYSSFGFFVQREQPVYPWWQLQEMLSVSRVAITSSLHTREFDFSYIVPRLINPKTTTILNEDVMLFVLRLHNSIHIGSGTTLSLGIQQALPMQLKHSSTISSNGGQSSTGRSGSLSMRGGTRYSIGIVSRW